MKEKKKTNIIVRVMLFVMFLAVSAVAIVFFIMSKQCGGSRDIQQMNVELPTSETTVTTTTTTVTTTKATTTTTTTEKKIDYEMKLDISNVAQYKSVNDDVAGWIYIKDTVINYPVVHGVSNEQYIHSDWKGNSSFAGCIYEDFRGDLDDKNLTLLYGHNMGDGSMFHGIKNFLNEEWGKEHPYFEVASEDKRYLYEVISAGVLYGESGADFSYWLPSQPTDLKLDKNDFEKYVRNIKSTANVLYCKDDELPEYGDRIIGLQTCYSGNNDGMRCVVFAKCLGER